MSDDFDMEGEEGGGERADETVQSTDLPHYLFLKDPADKAEARRAYALNFVVSGEGAFHPQWVSAWKTIVQYLETGGFPEASELRVLKGGK